MSLQKDGSININSQDFVKGISRSPYLGIAKMVNLDIHSQPGALKIARALEKESGSTVTEFCEFAGYDHPNGDVYLLGKGELFQRDLITGWSNPNNFGTTDDGMFVWKNYVIAIRGGVSARMLAWGPLVGGASAEESFVSFTYTGYDLGTRFVTHVDLDDRVFIGGDNLLHELVQVDGQDLDPTDSTTYAFNEEVLILPEDLVITSIAELGTNLLIGTTYDSNQGVNGDYFIWNPNKSGTDASSPDQRIRLSGNGVQKLETSQGLIYAIVGENGKLMVSDNTTVREIIELKSISEDPGVNYDFDPLVYSSDVYDTGLIFGVTKDSGADVAVYQYKNEALTSFTTSQGFVDEGVRIGAVLALNDEQMLVAWKNESDDSVGVDVTSLTSRYQGYSAYFESQMYNVGRHLRDKTYQHIGFTLGKKLATDQGIRVKYRTALGEDWTTLNTWDFDTVGAVTAYEDQADLPSDLTNLQLRVELTTGTSDTTPELLSIYVV